MDDHREDKAASGYRTVVFTPKFESSLQRFKSEENIDALVGELSQRPESGKPIIGSVRQIRWPIPGKGKGGALRVYYVFAPMLGCPVYLLAAFDRKSSEGRHLPERLKSEWKRLSEVICVATRGKK